MPPQQSQQQQQSGFDQMTLRQKFEMLERMARFPALTLWVFLRRDLGLRLMNPLWLTGMAAVLIVLSCLAAPENRPDDLLVFALAGLTLGLRQRYLRWLEYNKGVRGHSLYLGKSIFDSPSFPAWFHRERRIARIIDPLAAGLTGALLLPYSRALALWLIFAAIALRAYEDAVYRRELHQTLDVSDGLTVSEVQGEIVDFFSPSSDANSRQQQPTQGIPTGLGGDIGAHVERRKAEDEPPPPTPP